MRNGWWNLAWIALAIPLLGMGLLGGNGGAPERNYRGAFVDRDGTRVEAAWIQAGGDLALSGELGRGTLRIPFDDIRSVEFSGDGRSPLSARVTLREGETVDVSIRPTLSFSGRTPVGLYQVRARDLKAVELSRD